jgi:hypothetical protein
VLLLLPPPPPSSRARRRRHRAAGGHHDWHAARSIGRARSQREEKMTRMDGAETEKPVVSRAISIE